MNETRWGLPTLVTLQAPCLLQNNSSCDCDSDVEDHRDSGPDPHTDPDPSNGAEQQIVLDEETEFDETQSGRNGDRRDVASLFYHSQELGKRLANCTYVEAASVQDSVQVLVPHMSTCCAVGACFEQST